MNPIDLETARRLIDYSGGDDSLKSLEETQIKGAVAIQNMLADPAVEFAYLADEVGMGKTYIALGVVAMLRYFNPMLRVLFICPSRNVQEKWGREYKGFVRTNIRVNQGRIRTRDGYPAAPYKSCRNVVELIRAATSGYYADFFIGKDSFSLALSEDQSTWERKRDELKALVPAHEWQAAIKGKADIKEQYARALNYILPEFDLVVIDEAHNFKSDFESSDRNRVLSRVFGFSEEAGYAPKMKRALLLSATPYDRDLNQLRNQLNLVGKLDLLPESICDEDQEVVRERLRRFMVRRLNSLKVNQELLTRNMYRREWRKGAKAEVLLETDEQKLVTALVQKKVGELLTRQSESASFQTGLLASFESFADSTRSEPVEFDGDRTDKDQSDAKDRNVLVQLTENYVRHGLGRTLPHPKMDAVVQRLAKAMFYEPKKQLVFVRRVKSVGEIKAKLDDAYNLFVSQYMGEVLISHPQAHQAMADVYHAYRKASETRDTTDVGDEVQLVEDIDASLPAKNDTFFTWFFRGEALQEVSELLKRDGNNFPTPDGIRKGLVSKSQPVVTLLEPNWAWYLCHREGEKLTNILDEHGDVIAGLAGKYIAGELAADKLEEFQACQIAFIEWWMANRNALSLDPLFRALTISRAKKKDKTINIDELSEFLNTPTIYQELETAGIATYVSPYQASLYDALMTQQDALKLLERFEIHKALMSFVMRTGHGLIDLYMARLMQGTGNLTADSRASWLKDFVNILVEQRGKIGFSTFYELSEIAANLEQIIKNNIPGIFEKNREEYPIYLSQLLNPVSPVIGASGQTTGRSSQARKFRMPGYPLALVSTDVFQEGEDLHTFCDSVTHYGLSGSPVSLEQKTGRVDRVGSLAQRRLTALDVAPKDEEYIQVTFPFVKESIEALQIRQICVNLNLFIESLHDVTNVQNTVQDSVNVADAIDSKLPIPDQILTRLESPFVPIVSRKNKFNSVDMIENQNYAREKQIEYLLKLVDDELDNRGEYDSVTHLSGRRFEIPRPNLGIMLRSAMASGELILSLTRHAELPVLDLGNREVLLRLMHNFSWCTFHRTIAIESSEKSKPYDVYFNAEMLVGGLDVTGPEDIQRIFERMESLHDPENYSKILSPSVMTHVGLINETTRISIDRLEATRIDVVSEDNATLLRFNFGGSMAHRSQMVRIYESDERCIFLSDATAAGFVDDLSPRDIIQRTWARNRQIDLVEFVVDPTRKIVGRVVHPAENMTFQEFLFCAYTLAVETDSLEYLLNKSDIH
jgi:hypothetical protein